MSTAPAAPSAAGPQSGPYQSATGRWSLVSLIMVGMVISLTDRQIIALLVDPIKADFGLTDTEFSVLVGPAFVISYILFGYPFGLLADRLQRRHVIALGVAVWSAATVSCGLAGSFVALAAARAVVGAGEAALMPCAMSVMSDLFPRERLPFVTGIFSISLHIGGASAFLIGGAILSAFAGVSEVRLLLFGPLAPWQVAFVLVGLPGLLLAVVFLFVQEPQRRVRGGTRVDPDMSGAVTADLMAFLRHNRRALVAQMAAAALLTIGAYAFVNWSPAFLVRAHGLPGPEAALYLGAIMILCGPAGAISGGALTSWWTEHRGVVDAPWRIMILSAVGSGIFGGIAFTSSVMVLSVSLLAVAILFGSLYLGVVHAALQLITPEPLKGRLAAILLMCMTGIGATSGPVLVALLTDYVFIAPERVGHSIAVIALFVGLSVSLILGTSLGSYRESYRRIAD